MITYQVEIVVDASIEEEWLPWMRTEHVPLVIATGLVLSYRIFKDVNQAHRYLFHYDFNTQSDLDYYLENFSPKLRAHPFEKFPNLFRAERQIFMNV